MSFWNISIYTALAVVSCLLLNIELALSLDTARTDLTSNDLARVRAITEHTKNFSKAEPFERMSAGATTSLAPTNANAFSHSSANLDFEGELNFKLGNGLFRKVWISSPSSTQASDGLGPLYNAPSCQQCHLKDGRGHPPESPDDLATSMLIRLAVPARSDSENRALETKEMLRILDPVYGGQLQDFAVAGLDAEGKILIEYVEKEIVLNGGEKVQLRYPSYSIVDLAYGPMDTEVTLSPRIAQPMIGLGLIETIHPDDIIAQEDPDDANGDGISGRINWLRNVATADPIIGRFGWKASTPTVITQAADAFNGDMGISTPLFKNSYGDCTESQGQCLKAPTGVQIKLGDTEAPDPVLELVDFYARNLAVPARRNVNDPETLHGKEVFYQAGCASCHTPKYVTRRDAEQPEHRFQLIWPYTDLLLHDMGEGLADHQTVGNANGREWRTPPLWGIGLTEKVNGHTYFLHDGRARNLLEAIIWHGGEAQASRNFVVGLAPTDRKALLQFLDSL